MSRWEYVIIGITSYSVHYIETLLKQWGKHGWELAAATDDRLYLKREKSDHSTKES